MTTSADSEELWVERAKRGDLHAFEQLYRANLRPIYGLCRRLLDSREDAEEMTQMVFLQAWRRVAGFRSRSRFVTWLRRIAVHRIIDERRSSWRRRFEAEGDHEPREIAVPAGDPGRAMDLERAIELLPAGPRRVLVLHDVEGFTHAEMARMLGVTTGTTKTQLFRARRAMRELLG